MTLLVILVIDCYKVNRRSTTIFLFFVPNRNTRSIKKKSTYLSRFKYIYKTENKRNFKKETEKEILCA